MLNAFEKWFWMLVLFIPIVVLRFMGCGFDNVLNIGLGQHDLLEDSCLLLDFLDPV